MEIDMTTIIEKIVHPICIQLQVDPQVLDQCAPRVIAYIENAARHLCEHLIDEVYEINIRRVHGSLPNERVKESIRSIYDEKHIWAFKIFLDETQVRDWTTQDGMPIYEIGKKNTTVHSYAAHWHTPIDGMNEAVRINKRMQEELTRWLSQHATIQHIINICKPVIMTAYYHHQHMKKGEVHAK